MTRRITSLHTAIARLREALKTPETDLNRDAAMQRFEFCFELAWKAVQEQARAEGLECQSPKGCLKLAFTTAWIDDEGGWLAMLEDRTPRPTPMTRNSPRLSIIDYHVTSRSWRPYSSASSPPTPRAKPAPHQH